MGHPLVDGGREESATAVSRDLLYIHGEENDGRDVQVLERDGTVFIGVADDGEHESVELTEEEAEKVKEALDDV